MEPSALLALPAEVRQQILCEALNDSTPSLVFEKQITTVTPLNDICKLLRADVDELSKSWTPEPGTTKVIVKSDEGLHKLADFHRRCTERAAAEGRRWTGFKEIQIPCIRNVIGRGGLKSIPPVSREAINPLKDWDIAALPPTVKKITFDLTMPRRLLKALEKWIPVPKEPCDPPPKELERFWAILISRIGDNITCMDANLIAAGRRKRLIHQSQRDRNTGVAFASIGSFPKSQTNAVLLSTYEVLSTGGYFEYEAYSQPTRSFFTEYFKSLRGARMSYHFDMENKREALSNERAALANDRAAMARVERLVEQKNKIVRQVEKLQEKVKKIEKKMSGQK